ncbi:MAG: CPBP family intramembrane metalloprotease [Verrucomicrobia bacterium]|nr:CPBP family intramembrane metalloprotease [Verrucomicrobiota bacterium]
MSDLAATFLIALWGIGVNWIAYKRGYYKLPQVSAPTVLFRNIIAIFLIYMGMMYIVGPFVGNMLFSLSKPMPPPAALLSFLQLFLMAALLVIFYGYAQTAGHGFFRKVWKNTSAPHAEPIYIDIAMGMMTWVLSFPFVVVVGQLLDFFIYAIFGVENYEQVAVRYLKTTMGSPSQLIFALGTILLLAPAIEEFLFRGCLQTFFKRHLGTKSAILLSSLCFALFHYASSQGVGNISLIGSLFVFACFLGFIYERQSSLFASIGLHMTFNLASAIRIVWGGE